MSSIFEEIFNAPYEFGQSLAQLRQPLLCHCEKLSDNAVIASEAKQSGVRVIHIYMQRYLSGLLRYARNDDYCYLS